MMFKRKADVSVIVSNYNNGRYLHAFMQSIVDSTVEPAELIMIDDGSTDDSLTILEEYKHLDFFVLIAFSENRGFTSALNAGLQAARSKYIMRADPDDILLPDRIENQFRFMEEHPDIDVSGANVIYFNDVTGREINVSNFPLGPKKILRTYKLGEHGLLHATVIAKATVYQSYRYQKIFPSEDYELFSRMVLDGKKIANTREPVNLIRVHPGSSTSNLQYQAICQTFAFRDKIFSTKTPKWRISLYFIHIKYYRSYQLTRNPVLRYLYLMVSVIAYPSKLFRRIVHKFI